MSGYGNTYSMRLEFRVRIRIVMVVKCPLVGFTIVRKEIVFFGYLMYLKTSLRAFRMARARYDVYTGNINSRLKNEMTRMIRTVVS